MLVSSSYFVLYQAFENMRVLAEANSRGAGGSQAENKRVFGPRASQVIARA
jgi:hypothetical protein